MRGIQWVRVKTAVPILYEDKSVIALNKPAGLAAVPIKGSKTPSALGLIPGAFVVHRIDRFTSGVLLFAKTERDREVLVQQFLEHKPLRQYLAVVRGQLPSAEGTLTHWLRKVGQHQKVSEQGAKGAAPAELRYSVERTWRGASLLRVTLVTGLQNQIRVQFAAIGHPVIGDRKYSPREADERRIDRVALHAARLEFTHPRTGKRVSLDCEPPPDFRSLLTAL